MKKSDLTPRQRRFVTAMLTARTIAEAAAAVGVTERTGLRYLSLPDVKAALAAALDDALGQVARLAVAAMTEALETLESIHQDANAPAGARVSAARAVFEGGPKLREARVLADRMSEIETKLAQLEAQHDGEN